MSICWCPCHTYPGVYPPPCGVCGHDTREGHMVGTIRDGWEPNSDATDLIREMIRRCEEAAPSDAAFRSGPPDSYTRI